MAEVGRRRSAAASNRPPSRHAGPAGRPAGRLPLTPCGHCAPHLRVRRRGFAHVLLLLLLLVLVWLQVAARGARRQRRRVRIVGLREGARSGSGAVVSVVCTRIAVYRRAWAGRQGGRLGDGRPAPPISIPRLAAAAVSEQRRTGRPCRAGRQIAGRPPQRPTPAPRRSLQLTPVTALVMSSKAARFLAIWSAT